MSDVQVTKAAKSIVDNPWRSLSKYTDARIGLGRAGISLPTHELLAFQLAHAKAQDAVFVPLDCEQLKEDIIDQNHHWLTSDAILFAQSKVADREQYLQRPDLGRCLNEASKQQLLSKVDPQDTPYDLSIVIVDGLSALAVQKHVPILLSLFGSHLTSISGANALQISRIAPLVVVEQGRVAIGDEIAQQLNAKAVLVMIGERPGLSSPDSLGLYFTWAPECGSTNESRNCISNVRPNGLNYDRAVQKLFYLLSESFRLQISGIHLKESSQTFKLDG
jgi:ethanolamine ammonia-lyase small subunit